MHVVSAVVVCPEEGQRSWNRAAAAATRRGKSGTPGGGSPRRPTLRPAEVASRYPSSASDPRSRRPRDVRRRLAAGTQSLRRPEMASATTQRHRPISPPRPLALCTRIRTRRPEGAPHNAGSGRAECSDAKPALRSTAAPSRLGAARNERGGPEGHRCSASHDGNRGEAEGARAAVGRSPNRRAPGGGGAAKRCLLIQYVKVRDNPSRLAD